MLQKFDERNRDLLVSVDGCLVHRDRAAISPFDSSVQASGARVQTRISIGVCGAASSVELGWIPLENCSPFVYHGQEE